MTAMSVAMVDLQPPRFSAWRPNPVFAVSRSKPFAEAGAGRYTHRVHSASLHTCAGQSHLALKLWCGMLIHLGGRRNRDSRLVDEPSGRPICATCEGRAIGAGQLGSREIAGRAVMFSPRGARA